MGSPGFQVKINLPTRAVLKCLGSLCSFKIITHDILKCQYSTTRKIKIGLGWVTILERIKPQRCGSVGASELVVFLDDPDVEAGLKGFSDP